MVRLTVPRLPHADTSHFRLAGGPQAQVERQRRDKHFESVSLCQYATDRDSPQPASSGPSTYRIQVSPVIGQFIVGGRTRGKMIEEEYLRENPIRMM